MATHFPRKRSASQERDSRAGQQENCAAQRDKGHCPPGPWREMVLQILRGLEPGEMVMLSGPWEMVLQILQILRVLLVLLAATTFFAHPANEEAIEGTSKNWAKPSSELPSHHWKVSPGAGFVGTAIFRGALEVAVSFRLPSAAIQQETQPTQKEPVPCHDPQDG